MASFSFLNIGKPTLVEIFSLPHLFHKAVEGDFSFYHTAVKKRILRRNSLFHLFCARFRKNRLIYVARFKNVCVGVIVASYTGGIGTIHWLYIFPKYRNKGLGLKLVRAVEEEMKKHSCHKVTLTTEMAPEFYRRLGFTTEGLLKKHWWNKDFHIMGKFL